MKKRFSPSFYIAMEKLIKKYLAKFDELNTLISFSFQNTDITDKKRSEKIIDDLLSFLILAYLDGIEAVSEMLKTDIQPDTSQMRETIYLKIDGKDFADRAKNHIDNDDKTGLAELAEDEYHRVYESAKNDGAKSSGTVKGKKWVTVGDDKVRDTHAYLEGMEVGIDDKFYTYDGDSALYPGDFSKAENNCGCRCIAVYI